MLSSWLLSRRCRNRPSSSGVRGSSKAANSASSLSNSPKSSAHADSSSVPSSPRLAPPRLELPERCLDRRGDAASVLRARSRFSIFSNKAVSKSSAFCGCRCCRSSWWTSSQLTSPAEETAPKDLVERSRPTWGTSPEVSPTSDGLRMHLKQHALKLARRTGARLLLLELLGSCGSAPEEPGSTTDSAPLREALLCPISAKAAPAPAKSLTRHTALHRGRPPAGRK